MDFQYHQNSPTITVVMPVYNVSLYVERCVQSVMNQTYPATECIIVDDASTDDSLARCKRLTDKYKGQTEFSFVLHDKNRGLSAARNTGTYLAKADFIYYVDSDDEMTPDCLEKLSAPIIQDGSIEMVIGDYVKNYSEMPQPVWFVVNSSNLMHRTPTELHSNVDIRKWYYHGNRLRPGNVWNKLIKLSFLRERQLYNREGILYEDWLWSFYLMRYVTHVAFVHDVTYIYYRRSDSIVTKTSYEERLRHHGYIYREMAENIEMEKWIEETERNLYDFCLCYVDAANNPDFQYAYNAYLRQLSDGNHRAGCCLLKFAQYASKKKAMRVIYRKAVQGLQQVRRIIGLVSK